MNVSGPKIYKAASKDESRSREILTQVFFDQEKQQLVAADSFMMAIVPAVDADNDIGGTIDPGAIKLACKHGNGHIALSDDSIDVVRTSWSVKRIQGKYPDWEQSLERCTTNADNAAPALVLNARKLYRLAQAICDDTGPGWLSVKVFLPQKMGDAIQIRPVTKNGAHGILMPLARQDSEDIDLTELARALKNDDEITADMRAVLKRLLGVA